MHRRRVDIDAESAAVDDMGEETVRQLRGETAVFVTGEAAVEIAPVGQIPAMRDKGM